MKSRRGWLVVFPGLQTGRLVSSGAGAVMYLPGLQHCYEQTCSPVLVLFSAERRTEPSLSRAGLTSIGLEIERTPFSNQTSRR